MAHTSRTLDHDLKPGTQLGRYEIIELLARGGMAEIYLVKSVGLHGFETRSVLKRLPPSCLVNDPALVNMFFDEARLASALRHPNIAQVFDIGEDDESYFFVMEYIDGINLRDIIKQCGRRGERIPLDCAIQIALGLAAGLHAAHEARCNNGNPLEVVHRDVSPHNVVVTMDGAIKLIDFGIAKSRERLTHTQTGVVKGKFAYMSPEQCRAAPVDRRSDLFAFGTMLYELTTMSRPHGDSMGPEMLHAIVQQASPDPALRVPGYPPQLSQIVNTLLQRAPEERYQSAREVHDALSSFVVLNQIELSPYRLAAWLEDLIGGPPGRVADTESEDLSASIYAQHSSHAASTSLSLRASENLQLARPRAGARLSTRAHTVPLVGESMRELETSRSRGSDIQDFLLWQAERERSDAIEEAPRMARGTEAPDTDPVNLDKQTTIRRATSLPYEEIHIDDTREGAAVPRGRRVNPLRVLLLSALGSAGVLGGVLLLDGELQTAIGLLHSIL